MKLPNTELRQFIYNRLNNAITYNARTIPVDSLPASDETFSYIQIGTISGEESGTKDQYATRQNVEIVVTKESQDALANFDEVEAVSSLVVDKLVDYIGDTANFDIIWCHYISSFESDELKETGRATTIRITLQYYITEI